MERQILDLVAVDRMDIPFSSLDQKLRRTRMKVAKEIAADVKSLGYESERTFAYVEREDKNVARGLKEAVAEFKEEFPKYGDILQGKINEKRVRREEHLYFGINEDCRLTGDDYLGVMRNLGISEHRAHLLYPTLMEISRELEAKKDRESRIVVGKYDLEE